MDLNAVIDRPIVQKIYKCKKSKSGNTTFSRKQIGVMVAGVSPIDDTTVLIGYSLCHRNDKYNQPGGNKVPNFDKLIAVQRAIKWNDPHNEVPEVPFSLRKPLGKFVSRCRTYYKDKALTQWLHYADYDHYERPVKDKIVDDNAEGC